MHHHISIDYQLVSRPKENVQIPVRYRVVDNTDLCTKTVYCDVDLPGERMPEWLSPTTFQMVNHYSEGIHVIHYNDGEVTNPDAEFFRYKLFSAIMLKERLKEGLKMEHC